MMAAQLTYSSNLLHERFCTTMRFHQWYHQIQAAQCLVAAHQGWSSRFREVFDQFIDLTMTVY
jgi:hypothetical protein